jgi:hypothetical protein
MSRNGLYIIGLFLITAVGGALRVLPALEHPLWFDEADSWRAAVVSNPPLNDQGLPADSPMPYKKFFQWDNHFETAPLTFLMVRISTDVLGTSDEWAMRVPGMMAGVLCIPLMFLLGYVVHSKSLGLITAALMAFDPNMVDQGMQARMYSIMMVLLLVVLIWSIHILRDPWRGNENRKVHPLVQWIGLGMAFGLLFSTSQFTVAAWVGVFFAGLLIVAIGAIKKRKDAKPGQTVAAFFVAYVIGMLVGIVGVKKLIERVFGGGEGSGDGEHLSFMEITKEIGTAAKDLIGLTDAGLVVYALGAVGLFLLLKKCKISTAVLVGVLIMNVLILYPFRKMHHFMDGRYLMLLQPTLFIGMGMLVVGWQNRKAMATAGLLVLVGYIGLQSWQSTHLENWRPQPDRYVFSQAIKDVRDKMEGTANETSLVHPGAAVILGQYYNMHQDRQLFTSIYDKTTHVYLDDAHIPASLKSEKVWMVMGMNNWEGQFARARKPLELLAKHYNVTIDDAELNKHLRRDRVVIVQVSKTGIELESRGVK